MKEIGALVIAAGLSSRMQTNKLLLPYRGKTIIEWALSGFLSAGISCAAVVGHQGTKLKEILHPLGITILENGDYSRGMSTSISKGIEYYQRLTGVDAVFLALADMPLIRSSTIRKLAAEYQQSKPLILAPARNGQRGHPVLFDRQMFFRLTELSGDIGARQLLKEQQHLLQLLEVDDKGIFLDIDDGEAYQELLKTDPDNPEKGLSGNEK